MIIDYLIDTIQAVRRDEAIIVAFDGVDTAGKTTLANMVFAAMKNQNLLKPVRISIDKFHNPRKIRIKRGELSPEGFFYDSFNYDKIIQNIIKPIKNKMDKIFPESYDYKSEKDIKSADVSLTNDTVILFDGIFMNRDELYKFWDLSIFLDISFDTVLKRALKRDIPLFGNEEIIKEKYLKRYIPGEKLYIKKCNPIERADIVIDNNNYLNPKLIK